MTCLIIGFLLGIPLLYFWIGDTASSPLAGMRPMLVYILLHLCPGHRYAHTLDEILLRGGFASPGGRWTVLREMTQMIDPMDVVDAFAVASRPSRGADRDARRLWTEHMRRAGIRHEPGNRLPGVPPGVPRIQKDDSCILGVLATVSATHGFRTARAGGTAVALDTLKHFGTTGALYFYYAPDPGERLDAGAARRMFDLLRAGAEEDLHLTARI
jgi:hypothetical protein